MAWSQRSRRRPGTRFPRVGSNDEATGASTPIAEDKGQDMREEAEATPGRVQSEVLDAQLDQDGNAQQVERIKATTIQILDLHTENPVVSYNGLFYSCQWAQNIGTELLFTAHDPSNPLPVLRSLPGDVDLLAASSARIISEPATLEPKFTPRPNIPRRGKSHLAGLYKQLGRSRVAQAQRSGQINFLERLIDIKQEKGEEDLVTVNVQKRLTNAMWKVQLREEREAEKKRLNKIISKGRAGVVEAREKLSRMNKEDEEIRKMEEGRGNMLTGETPGADQGNKRKPPVNETRSTSKRSRGEVKESARGVAPGKLDEAAESSQIEQGIPGTIKPAQASEEHREILSTPTPTRWSHLEQSVEMDEEGQHILGNDEELYDEDPPGEEDDTQL